MSDSTQQSKTPRSTVDPGILEMGSSVSVNDELRRNVTAETTEIDHACSKLVSDVASEEDRAKEMQKSKHHANKEQSGLIQSTREMLDTNHMNTHIFHGLQSRVETEFLFTSSPQSKRNETVSDGANVVTPTDSKPHSPTSVFAIQQINNENKEQITIISKKLVESIVAIHKFKSEFSEMLLAKNTIYHKIKSEHLKVVLANAKHKVQLVEDILKDKQMHHHTNKVNCDMIESQNKSLQDQLVVLENELAEKKKNSVELEDSIRKVQAKLDDMKCVATTKKGEFNKELKYFDEKLTQLSSTFDEAASLIKKRNDAKCNFDHLRVDRGASFTSKMSLQSEITAMHKKLEGDRRTLHNESILAETIAKSMKETLEVDLSSKKAELEVLISKEKSHVEFLKTQNVPGKDKLLCTIQEQKEELIKMKDEISRMKLEIEAKGSTLKEQKRLLVDHRDEYENVFAKIETQLAEEKETFVALERQMNEAVTNAIPDEYGLTMRNVKLYKYAAKTLQASIDKETKFAEMSAE